MSQIQVPHNVLLAVSQAMAKKDVRYYLNGVCLETGPSGAFLLATDGSFIIVSRLDAVARPLASFIIPDTAVKQLLASKWLLEMPQPEAYCGKFRELPITAGALSLTVKEIEGRFPEWRRVTKWEAPRDNLAPPAQFGPFYVAAVDKAGQALKKRSWGYPICPSALPNGVGMCELNADTFAFVMPLSTRVVSTPTLPTWAA